MQEYTENIYQYMALRTESPALTAKPNERLVQGLMGLAGEAGEAIDILKKHMFQGHELDRQQLALELGDVAWYLALSADAIGYTMNDIFRMNIEKLQARYPNGFEAEKSVNRKECET